MTRADADAPLPAPDSLQDLCLPAVWLDLQYVANEPERVVLVALGELEVDVVGHRSLLLMTGEPGRHGENLVGGVFVLDRVGGEADHYDVAWLVPLGVVQAIKGRDDPRVA